MTDLEPTSPVAAGKLEAAYDAEAARYDSVRYQDAEGRFFDSLEGEILCGLLRPLQGSRILDVPVGTGRSAIPMAKQGGLVTAVDISAGMLAQAQKKARAADLDISFRQASVFELPFDDAQFDAVTSFKFFHLLTPDQKLRALAEMRRVLKPGGTLVAEFNSPFYGGVLAFFRYYFRKKHPGDMRQKCLFPDQVRRHFQGLRVTGIIGVKLPFAGALSRLTGERFMKTLNHRVGRIPVLRQVCYGIVVVAVRPLSHTES